MLLWVGSAGALQERSQKVMHALAQLLAKAGVKFAILGREEKSTGDLARRVGNEFLFETMAQENIETLNRYKVKTIVTACPYCFNIFHFSNKELLAMMNDIFNFHQTDLEITPAISVLRSYGYLQYGAWFSKGGIENY